MEEQSRVKLLDVANRVLSERGEPVLPDDFLTVALPDPIYEISRKLDLLLAHHGIEDAPAPASEVESALALLEQPVADAGRSGRAGRRSGAGKP